ncbi:helix-turn-helix domain-containing protein [Mycolicibacterium sp.]|uniref:helix-turn-helix domain-containing protein n=1 Tax=Mycolicibacterium sp. TaxID=2320850 RepID=UPI0037CBA091
MEPKPSSTARTSHVLGGIGGRLREGRLAAGMSVRELARQLGMSPSFVSQFENGKSQPSVGTLYAISQILNFSVDALFASSADDCPDGPVLIADRPRPTTAPNQCQVRPVIEVFPGDRSEAAEDAERPRESCGFSITRESERRTLVLDTGVTWEQLVRGGRRSSDFLKINYPPGSSSANDDRMMRHAGIEYGYLIEGELQVTVGFDEYTMRAGDSLCLDSSRPHLYRNLGTSTARGIWFVQDGDLRY